MNKLLECVDINKSIDNQTIIKHLNLSVYENQIHIIKGPNGSGKSVTLKLLAKLYQPTNGKINWFKDVSICYIPDKIPKSMLLKVNEYIDFICKNNGIVDKKEINYFIKMFNLEQFVNMKIQKCSKGTQQKLNIIQALISNRELILIDEPTDGLDRESQQKFYEAIEGLNKKTIILVSHDKNIDQYLSNARYYDIEGMKEINNINKPINYYQLTVLDSSSDIISKQNVNENVLEEELMKLINSGFKIKEVIKK